MKNKLLFCTCILFYSCQGLTDFVPPDFKEKLSVNAIINNGRDQNKIIIEKTFQYEFHSELNASLEDLLVTIRTKREVIFEYFNPKSGNRIDTIKLPVKLEFIPDQIYTLIVSEKNSTSIISEILVPYPPIIPVVSIEGTTQTFLPPPLECHNPVKSVVLNLNFKSDEDQFYYLYVEGYLNPIYKDTTRYLIDYNIIDSNSPYFESFIYGFKSIGFPACTFTGGRIPGHTYKPSYFDGKTIPEKICNTKIKIDINKEYYDHSRPITITLNSIPRDLYHYEKSYYNYIETLNDPFSEPVYINGNMKDGFGIFSICSGSHTSLLLPSDSYN